ncbi:MFS transporter [bacterium RCC_150]
MSDTSKAIHVTTEATPAATRRRAVLAGSIGNMVEWYDFAVYGLFAVIIAANFFPNQDPTASLLSTFAVFAVAFFIRPLGAVFFGHLGDKYGRKNVLLMTVALMGASTIAIGLTPSYAAIGIAAPALLALFRLIQGFSAGGEWSGSSVYTVEYAPRNRRNLYGSWVQVSASAGTLMGSLTAAICGLLSSEVALRDWVWRIPFIIGGVIGVVGLVLRAKLEDTPEFRKTKSEPKPTKNPFGNVLRNYRSEGLIAIGITIAYSVSIYMFSTYLPTYIKTTTNVRLTDALLGNSLQLVVLMILIPFAAILADKIGSRKLLIAFAVLMIVCVIPLFQLIAIGTIGSVILGQVLFAAIVSLIGGTAVTTTTRLFPIEVRYTGLGISYNIAVAAFGGTAPLISTWLIGTTGNPISPAFYVIFAALIAGLVAVFALKGSDAAEA